MGQKWVNNSIAGEQVIRDKSAAMEMTASEEEAAFTEPLFREADLASSAEAVEGSSQQRDTGAVHEGGEKTNYALPENPTAQVPFPCSMGTKCVAFILPRRKVSRWARFRLHRLWHRCIGSLSSRCAVHYRGLSLGSSCVCICTPGAFSRARSSHVTALEPVDWVRANKRAVSRCCSAKAHQAARYCLMHWIEVVHCAVHQRVSR